MEKAHAQDHVGFHTIDLNSAKRILYVFYSKNGN